MRRAINRYPVQILAVLASLASFAFVAQVVMAQPTGADRPSGTSGGYAAGQLYSRGEVYRGAGATGQYFKAYKNVTTISRSYQITVDSTQEIDLCTANRRGNGSSTHVSAMEVQKLSTFSVKLWVGTGDADGAVDAICAITKTF